jgi:hypothetical protein
VEPFLIDGATADSLKVFTPVEEGKDPVKRNELEKKTQEMKRKEAEEAAEDEAEAEGAEARPSSSASLSGETQAAARLPGDLEISSAENDDVTEKEIDKEKKEVRKKETQTPRKKAAANTVDAVAPLETVLQMPPPGNQSEKDTSKPPHLQAPPYVHHFDTYTLVQQVEKGGFTNKQAITSMKAVRGLLALNLGVAKEGLVSKYDVENVSLLQLS